MKTRPKLDLSNISTKKKLKPPVFKGVNKKRKIDKKSLKKQFLKIDSKSQISLDSQLEMKTVRVYESVDDQKLQKTAKKMFIKKGENDGYEVFMGIADKKKQLNRFRSAKQLDLTEKKIEVPIFSNLKIQELMGQRPI